MNKHILKGAFAFFLAATGPANAAIFGYYVGADNLPTLTSGTYAGQANPNYNRLTFLYAHSYPVNPPPGEFDASVNHFHSIGSYRLSGAVGSGSTIFANSRLPEGTKPAIPLQAGSGVFAGKQVSGLVNDPIIGEYTRFAISPLSQLRAFHENGIPNEPEDYMYFGQVHPTNPALTTAASNQRYSTTNLMGADVAFELVSLTAGLNFGNAAGTPLLINAGDRYGLGNGDSFAVFEPHFWTDQGAAPGLYEAKVKLVDRNNVYGNSGEFRWEFQVIPEPSSAVLLAAVGLLGVRRHRKTTTTT
jgi:hypothetical protein